MKHTFKTMLLGVAIAMTYASPVFAQPDEIETVFYETETQHCAIKATAMPKWSVLRLRMNRKESVQNCALTKEETIEIFSASLKAHKESGDEEVYTSMMIGHLGGYSGIQKFLMDTARNDPAWSQETENPITGGDNGYVNSVLSRPRVMDVFNEAGNQYGYSFTKMDCEKVLISDSGLPIDAFCWLDMVHK